MMYFNFHAALVSDLLFDDASFFSRKIAHRGKKTFAAKFFFYCEHTKKYVLETIKNDLYTRFIQSRRSRVFFITRFFFASDMMYPSSSAVIAAEIGVLLMIRSKLRMGIIILSRVKTKMLTLKAASEPSS